MNRFGQNGMKGEEFMENSLMFIDGAWVEPDSGEYFPVLNPATGELAGSVPNGGYAEAVRAIDAAHLAFADWSAHTAEERAEYLMTWHRLILQNLDDLAATLTMEQGKPLAEAKGEIGYGAKFIEWYAEEAKRVYGSTIPASARNKRVVVLRQPVGVVAAITPWNFPAAMVTRKIAPALAAGCTVILKPAEQTPLTSIKLYQLLEQAGLPKGVANLVTGDAVQIGKAFMEDSRVRKITFTGSTEVGKLLMKQAADTMKNISLELGGHAPFLVFDDADVESAVKGVIASKFRNAGQTCICANRILVQEGAADRFIALFKKEASALKVGNGLEEGTVIGPLIDKAGYEKVSLHVQDALAKGAHLVCGGEGFHQSDEEDAGYFYQPTVLSGVTADMRIMQEETFGPVAPVVTFKTEEEGIRMANDSVYGLAAYVFTESLSRAIRVGEKLEFGIVGINDGAPSTAQAPFGGFKESGLGREGGKEGIESFLETKFMSIGI